MTDKEQNQKETTNLIADKAFEQLGGNIANLMALLESQRKLIDAQASAINKLIDRSYPTNEDTADIREAMGANEQ